MSRPNRAAENPKNRTYKEKKISDITVTEENSNPDLMYMMDFQMHYEQLTIATIVNMYKDGEIDFKADIQRGEVWNRATASLFIHSMLMGFAPILSSIVINRKTKDNGTTVNEILDGKQRGLVSIVQYIENEFPLCGLANEPYINYRGKPCKINGLHFNQLPEGMQNKLLSTGINVAIAFNATHEQQALIFSRINNSKPMTNFDKARANKEDMSDILSLADHEIFSSICGENMKKKLAHHQLIVQAWEVENSTEPKAEGRYISKLMSTLNMSEEEQNRLKNDFDRVLAAYKIVNGENSRLAKTSLNKTHFLSYLPYVGDFPTDKACAEWIKEFYSDIPKEYLATTEAHPNNTSNLRIRLEIVKRSVEKFLSDYVETDENGQMAF